MYLLDTNIASAIINQNKNIEQKILELPLNSLHISSITSAELKYGMARRPEAIQLKNRILNFLERVEVLSFDDKDASAFSELKSNLQNQGKNLSCMDILIASHVLSRGLILVTADQAFFNFKSDLKIENWLS